MKVLSASMKGPLVIATIEGRKTQTRRIMKPQPEHRENESVPGHYGTFFNGWNLDHDAVTVKDFIKHCPYGVPGDRLWIKETHYLYGRWIDRGADPFTGKHSWTFKRAKKEIYYFDTLPCKIKVRKTNYRKSGYYKRPSMERKDSRLSVELTDIRAERLQGISAEEIRAEGVTLELFREQLRPLAEKLKIEEPHWIVYYEMGECGTFCFNCGEKRRKQLLREAKKKAKAEKKNEFGKENEVYTHRNAVCNLEFLDGGWTCEEDSPPFCETCQIPLHYNPSDYCFEQEMDRFIENGVYPNPLDAYAMLTLLDTTNFHDEENEVKFLKIAWRFLWNSINGNWDDNPWVWVLTFKLEGLS